MMRKKLPLWRTVRPLALINFSFMVFIMAKFLPVSRDHFTPAGQ
jgi:hypothetical protein